MTRAITPEDQKVFEEVWEKVKTIADTVKTENEFISQVAEIPEVGKIFPSGPSASGGITFTIVVICSWSERHLPRIRKGSLKKKFEVS